MDNYGFLSVLPPLIAIILAVVTKNVLISLFLGIFLGVTILFKGNVFYSLPAVFRDVLFKQAADGYNASVIILVLFIGGMVMLVSNSGGADALAIRATKHINSKRKAIIATWIAGLIVWFSDFANATLVGPIFQPITDRMKISREKLAWIVDATSAPVCMLLPISGFGVFGMSCIDKEFANYNVVLSAWDTFIATIPLQFYCLGALYLVPLIACTGKDFGPMVKAERRTAISGEIHWPHAQPLGMGAMPKFSAEAKPRMSLIVYPLLALFVVFFAILIANGFPHQRIVGVNIRTGLTTGYFLAGMICLGLTVFYKLRNFRESFDLYISGMRGNLFLVLTLLFAWSLSAVCKELGTADYIVSAMRGNLPACMVAPMLFFVGCLISLATGTSYGTFAILMPIAVPMASMLGAPLVLSIAAVFSGGIFGDHCSPISDTTLLSSMGASCDHVEHVKTQMPYAILIGLLSFLLYVSAFWIGSRIVLLGVLALLVTISTILLGNVWNYTMNKI